MSISVTNPKHMNEIFARAFNTRKIDNLLSLYEPEAVLLTDGSGVYQLSPWNWRNSWRLLAS